jgi:hypothetical protein
MTIRLKKTKPVRWMGHGFGDSKADYAVVGHDHISVTYFAGRWNARNETENTVIARADTLKDLRTRLTAKL